MRLLSVAVLAFAASGAWAQNVKIGELNSYKVFPAFLEPYRKGWELALEEINAQGGVNGRPLEVVARYHGLNKSATLVSLVRKEFWRAFPGGTDKIRPDRGAKVQGES